MADYTITGDTKLDAGGFNKGLSSMTVAAGTLIADLVKTATSKLTGLAQASVGVGMSFDASMSQVAATMGTSIDQIQNLTDTAKEMGRTTAFTATQAADALNYLALAGYDANKAAEVLPSVLNLAAAGGMDLAYASDLVTDAMASLNIEASKQNVDEFGNKLAMAARKANANVAQLGEAILTVGGTAANLQGGTTELTTALGLLANVGIKSAEGGTHLRNIILSLQSPTDDAAKLMQQLGLNVYDAQGNMRGLNDILGDLNSAMDGMTQGGKDSIINQLFNKTDLAAVNGLLAAQGDQWDALAGQIDNAGDAMGQMADTQLDNLQGAVTIMQSALEGLQLAIYDKMEPALKMLAQGATETISTLTTILSQDGPAAMLDAAVNIMGGLVDGITQKIPLVMSAATGIIIKLTQYLGDHADDLFDAGVKLLENLIVGIQNNLPALITAAAQLLAKFAAALISHLPDLLKCGAALLTTLVDGILLGIANLGEAAIACVAKIVGVWDGSYTEWGNIGTNIVLGIKNGIIGAWDGLVSGVKSKVEGMVGSVKKVLGIHSPSKVFDEIGVNTCLGLAQGLAKGTNKVKDAAKTVVASVTDTATQIADGVTTVTETVTETMADGSTQQKQVITETSKQIVNGVEKTVKTVTTRAADGAETVTQTIEDVKATVVSTTKDTQTQLVDGVKVTVEKTTQLLADGSEQVSTVTTQTGTEIIDGVERTVKTVTTIAADGTKTVSKTIEDAGPQFSSAAELLTYQFTEKLNSSWEQINKAIQSDVIGSIQTLFKAIQDGDLESIATWSAAYFWNACTQEQRTQIQTFAMDALSKLSSSLSGVFQNVAGLAASFVGQFVPAVAAATGAQEGLNIAMDANPIMLVISLIGMLVGALVSFASTNKSVGEGFKKVWYGVEDITSFIFESILRVIGLSVQGFVSAVNAIIDTYNTVAKALNLDTISRVSNPLWKAADRLAEQRKQRKAERKLQDEDAATDSGSKKVIESLTDTHKETRQDGATITTKTLTEKLQDENGMITTQVTKTITEAGKQLVDGVERSYKTITTIVDGVQTKVETILDDLDKSSSSGSSSGSATPLPDNTGAIEDNTAAILAANEKLAEMVRQADSLVLSDNVAVSRSVAASGTAQIAAAANNYHRDGDTNIVQNIYSKAQTAADLARETRWEADRAKATKH